MCPENMMDNLNLMKTKVTILFALLLISHSSANAISYNITQFSGNDNSLVQRQTSFQNGDSANILNNITADRDIGDFGITTFTVNGNNNKIDGTGGFSGFISSDSSNYTFNNVKMDNFYTTVSGGAIVNYGNASIVGGSFTANTTTSGYYGGGAIYNKGGLTISAGTTFVSNSAIYGGAIFNDSPGVTDITGATFTNNSVTYNGGAIANNGGTLSILNTSFNGNTALHYGGAIANYGITNITDTSFNGNQSLNNDSYNNGGGAIYNNGTLTIFAGTLGTTFDNNTSASFGGAIYNNSGTINMTDAEFSNNSATSYGGAIFNGSTLTISKNTTGTIFTRNTAADGGAIYNASVSTLNITDANFNHNNASSESGGAIYNKGNLTIYAGTTGTTFNGNSAVDSGGAILNDYSGTANINGATFSNNTATTYSGGAIYNSWGSLNLNNSSFTSNSAFASGGAIYTAGTANITDGSFINNKALDNSIYSNGGGAIFNVGTLTILKGTSGALFQGNTSTCYGGAIYNGTPASTTSTITGATFINNSATSSGGGVYNYSGILNISGGSFSGNYNNSLSNSYYGGGAIYNFGTLSVTDGTSFINNGVNTQGTTDTSDDIVSTDYGGAIYNNSGTLTLINANFQNNKANVYGGAIYNTGNLYIKADGANSVFSGNTDSTGSNAIYSTKDLYLNAGKTSSTASQGSIIFNDKIYASGNNIFINSSSNDSVLTKGNVIFNAPITASNIYIYDGNVYINSLPTLSGLYYLSGGTANFLTYVPLSSFNITGGTINYGNMSAPILNMVDRVLNINAGNVNFIHAAFSGNSNLTLNNSASTLGLLSSTFDGSLYTSPTSMLTNTAGTSIISESSFSNYTKAVNGGVINNSGNLIIEDSNFTNNTASSKGGAIYNSGILSVIANGKNVSFLNNSASGDSNDIYLASGSTLNLNSRSGNTLKFSSGVDSVSINNIININKSGVLLSDGITQAQTNGEIILDSAIKNSTVNLYDGTLSLNSDNYLDGNNLSLNGGMLNMINHSIGTMSLANLSVSGTTNLAIDADLANSRIDKITSVNPVSGSGILNIKAINLLSDAKSQTTSLSFADNSIKNHINLDITKALGPIYKYDVSYNSGSGLINFASQNINSPNSVNPSVLASSVASNIGGYINQINSYQQAFYNMDMMMSLPKTVREEEKFANRYASSDTNSPMVYSPIFTPEENKGLWFRPYVTFERVPLVNGPNVSNIAYGNIIGGDTDLLHLKHGFDGVFTLYAGYNGSHQTFDGVGIYQNGGVLGATGTFYKGNLFTALTANVGSNGGVASTIYGQDSFTLLTSGLASKTGYNFEILKGKFIFQPSFLISYTFVKTFDYTNAAGVSITSDPLNAIQIVPGIKLIANLKNDWQPYLGVNMIWNIMDQSKFYANDVALPQISINPYVEYGVGVIKRIGDRLSGFAQAMITNGGRNGISFQVGFRLAL